MKLILLALAIGAVAYLGGRHRLGKTLPAVAFAAFGALLGPLGLKLFDTDRLLQLRPLILFCVAWIGLVIGTQADIRLWRRIGWQIPKIAIGIGVVGGLFAALPFAIALAGSRADGIAIATVSLVMASAAAPSTLTQFGRGRLKNLAKAVSGLDDFAALFLAALPFCMISPEGLSVAVDLVMRNLVLIALAGILLGIAMVLLVTERAHLDERLTICMGIVATLAGTSADLGLAPFVVAGFAGMVLINTRFNARERIYQVIVDAERPIGLFVLIYAGALVVDLDVKAFVLGAAWISMRFIGRYTACRWMKAPSIIARQSLSLGAAAPVVVVAFHLLIQSPMSTLCLNAVLCGWITNECLVLVLQTKRGYLEAARA